VQPFIIDPHNYDKATATKSAVEYVEAFLDLNGVPHVDEYLWAPDDTKKPPGKNPWHDNGFYWFGTLFVNLRKSRTPVKVPGFSWSYTGFKADLTAPGILAHETGHHVHFHMDKKHSPREFLEKIKLIAGGETAVSGYEPNVFEVFAEAMRLFILNPELLKAGRPKRYELITALGLKPLHAAPWQDVLKNAHPKLVKATENWIKK
jgi:hypothetical protein